MVGILFALPSGLSLTTLQKQHKIPLCVPKLQNVVFDFPLGWGERQDIYEEEEEATAKWLV